MGRGKIEAHKHFSAEDFDTQAMLELGRKCFEEGYTQAEKEYRLNRAKIREILENAEQVRDDWSKTAWDGTEDWGFREEILNRYNKKHSNLGCGIEFPHFGGNYPDAVCINGYLWDLDSGGPGEELTIGGDDPCPICNTEKWLENVMEMEEFETEDDALNYVEYLKKKYMHN